MGLLANFTNPLDIALQQNPTSPQAQKLMPWQGQTFSQPPQQPQGTVQDILTNRQIPQQNPLDLLQAINQISNPTGQDIGNAAIARYTQKNPAITSEQMAGQRLAPNLAILKQLGQMNLENAQAQFFMGGGQAGMKPQQVFDKQTNTVRPVSNQEVVNNPSRYVSFDEKTGTPLDYSGSAGGNSQPGQSQPGTQPPFDLNTALMAMPPADRMAAIQLKNANQKKDIEAVTADNTKFLSTLNFINDAKKQNPIASSGFTAPVETFMDTNFPNVMDKVPFIGRKPGDSQKQGEANTILNFDSLSNALDGLKSTFGARVTNLDVNMTKQQLNAAPSMNVGQRAALLDAVANKVKLAAQMNLQYANDVRTGKAYMPNYQSPAQGNLEQVLNNSTSPIIRQEPGNGNAAPPDNSGPMAPPQVGQVKNGFRFNGGDPNDQKSWSAIQ